MDILLDFTQYYYIINICKQSKGIFWPQCIPWYSPCIALIATSNITLNNGGGSASPCFSSVMV